MSSLTALQATNEKAIKAYQAQEQERRKKFDEFKLREMIASILNRLHDGDRGHNIGYGPIDLDTVEQSQLERFRRQITAICKDYL